MGITRIGYNGFVVTTAILMVREGVYVEAAGVFLVVALAGKWAYSRLTRTEPPPTSDTLLGAYEAPPPPPAEEVLKTEWITKRELGILAAVAVVGGILFLNRDKGGFIHVMGGRVRLSVDFKDLEPIHQVGRHFTYSIPSGSHRVGLWDAEIGGNSRYLQVDVRDDEAFMLSVNPDLCIVQVDMGGSCAQARDDQGAWDAVRTNSPVVREWARRAGYTEDSSPQGEAQASEMP
ncbi:hypothetical protein D7X96_00570 [Corallococcus interemptor]|uniref:Uncharacterized protein n=1 Tax=Corallococcus interemptor TaxID=2316720 RepID=A0A3A8QZ79_9BACT|nr:hypothetical protein [Corallococcus interemptor]RKH74089.1 hypothetical protein D7X96_00570 [Corallococcus interemptor]